MTHSKDPTILFMKNSLIIETYKRLIYFKIHLLENEKDPSKRDDIEVEIYELLNSMKDEV